MRDVSAAEWNWARTHRFNATEVQSPRSLSELQAVVGAASAAGRTVRCVGSRHSFTDIADGQTLLDLSRLPERFDLHAGTPSVTVSSAMTYARLAELLEPSSLAVPNTASLPHITLAGAIATGTHGSGDTNGNLATSVVAVELVTADGSLRHVTRDDPDFGVAAISLGALGVVVSLELALLPAFDVRQLVHNAVTWDALIEGFDPIFGSAYSTSVFTDWVDHVQLWTKERTDAPAADHEALHDGVLATEQHHPIPSEPGNTCTHQGPTPGRWHERLPHFRASHVPSVGAEVQSEVFVERTHARGAIQALRSIGADMAPHLLASEIRTVGADDLWLSQQYRRDCVGLHFTWRHDMGAAKAMTRLIVDALDPFSPLPHWAKVFDPDQHDFSALYPRLADALSAFERADPTGTFRNHWFTRTFG